AKNVAIVTISATIPRSGLRYGQKIDCYVSSLMGATDLTHGRLMTTPVEEADIRNSQVAGLASGAVQIEDPKGTTTGKILGGIVLHKNFPVRFIDRKNGNIVTLLLDAPHASFSSSFEVARVINEQFSFESGNVKIATATNPGVIKVQLPKSYEDAPVQFVAELLNVGIDHPHTQARVIVNARTGTVIVTGEVEISPVLITHRGLVQIQITGTPRAGGTAGNSSGGFIKLEDRRNPESSQQLKLLVESLNELRVPTKDIIEILRELHKSGKLHAEYIER
ncbi:MAG: flagellar basal body P-ring protein FlgI, partial [Planctomycetes bacterium]|nr:flagellar basal body P-ring protein FlgI [Planctomycetota bacterium]